MSANQYGAGVTLKRFTGISYVRFITGVVLGDVVVGAERLCGVYGVV